MKRLWLFGLMLFLSGALVTAGAQPEPHIQGASSLRGWTIDVQGSRGAFSADGENWDIEFFNRSLGMSGFLHIMEFVGRKPENFIYLQVFVNDAGNSFWIFAFNYKLGTAQWGFFEGDYGNVRGIEAKPTLMEEYVPTGKVPDYRGQDFRVFSNTAKVSPTQGTISHPELQLSVYPVTQIVVTNSWSEFWSIGIDPQTRHTYLLFFYTISSNTTLIDLWNGRVFGLPLGQATITGGTITVTREVNL